MRFVSKWGGQNNFFPACAVCRPRGVAYIWGCWKGRKPQKGCLQTGLLLYRLLFWGGFWFTTPHFDKNGFSNIACRFRVSEFILKRGFQFKEVHNSVFSWRACSTFFWSTYLYVLHFLKKPEQTTQNNVSQFCDYFMSKLVYKRVIFHSSFATSWWKGACWCC